MPVAVLDRAKMVDPATDIVPTSATAQQAIFTNAVRLCKITNNHATLNVWYRANTGANDASASAHDGRINPGQTVDISDGGLRAIKDVSVFFPSGTWAAADLNVVGLQ